MDSPLVWILILLHAVFSLGNLIYYSMEIERSMKEDLGCKFTHVLGFTFILRMLFVLIQTYFIFKGPEVSQLLIYACRL